MAETNQNDSPIVCQLPYVDSLCTTKFENMEYNFIWKIENFSNLISGQVDIVESDYLSWNGAPIHSLRLRIINSRDQEHLQLIINPSMPWLNRKLHLKAKVSILNINSGKHHATTTLGGFLGIGAILKKPDFISKAQLIENADSLLSKNSLTIVCELRQSGLSHSSLKGNELDIITIPNRRQIKNQEHTNTQKEEIIFDDPGRVAEDYSKLFENPIFTDAVILVSETRFKIHKAVVATRCPVFCAMFNPQNNMMEQKTGIVKITDISPNIFKELLRYIYCGEVKNIEDIVSELIVAADKYALDGLKSMCVKIMCDILSVENAIECLRTAEQLQINVLKQKVLKLIEDNPTVVLKQNNLDAVDFVKELLGMLISK